MDTVFQAFAAVAPTPVPANLDRKALAMALKARIKEAVLGQVVCRKGANECLDLARSPDVQSDEATRAAALTCAHGWTNKRRQQRWLVRSLLLAYAFVRGVPYARVEAKTASAPSVHALSGVVRTTYQGRAAAARQASAKGARRSKVQVLPLVPQQGATAASKSHDLGSQVRLLPLLLGPIERGLHANPSRGCGSTPPGGLPPTAGRSCACIGSKRAISRPAHSGPFGAVA